MKRLSLIAVIVFCYSSAVACLKPDAFLIENTELEPDTKIPFEIVDFEPKDSIQYWGTARKLGVSKPYIYEAWPLGSFYDENDGSFNIISH